MDADILERQTVLYDLIESLRGKDNWCGETHIQKAAYFVEQLSGHALGYDYLLYKHGPYSFSLNEDLSSMKSLRFVDEVIAHPNYGPRLKQNPEVKKMLHEDFGKKAAKLAAILNFVADKLCDYGVATLERLATALYFTKQEIVSDVAERAQRINQIKPHISVVLALDAIKTVEGILQEWDKQNTHSSLAA